MISAPTDVIYRPLHRMFIEAVLAFVSREVNELRAGNRFDERRPVEISMSMFDRTASSPESRHRQNLVSLFAVEYRLQPTHHQQTAIASIFHS